MTPGTTTGELKLLGLPGRDQKNELWMRDLLDALRLGSSRVVHYRHWDGGEPNIHGEVTRLGNYAPDLVVAKSMGTIVATLAAEAEVITPRLMVLIGVPIAHLPEGALAPYRSVGERIPTLFIQQTDDVTGAFERVEQFAADLKCSTAIEVPGMDHQYENVPELVAIIRLWVMKEHGAA